MIEFILNDKKISTKENLGMATLDYIRKVRHLKGSKLVCKEGECGACSVLIGTLKDGKLHYQSMTSCIMPLANAHGKHIVTIEGLNFEDKLSPVQKAMVDEFGTQCGFCTPGFVVSLSGYLLTTNKPSKEGIIAAIDGNICRCTGYKSIERATDRILTELVQSIQSFTVQELVDNHFIPAHFSNIKNRLQQISTDIERKEDNKIIGGGTDLYVQRPFEMYEAEVKPIYDDPELNKIEIIDGICTFGASLTMGDLGRSKIFSTALPNSAYIFKLLSSTQIRNMATIGGNLVNASPIGDFTILLLGLDSNILISDGRNERQISLKDFYQGYKVIDLKEKEYIKEISFKIPNKNSTFHFEKISQRKYFDIATVNFSSHIEIENNVVVSASLAIGGVGPIPMYLHNLAKHLIGKTLNTNLIESSFKILQDEISPISDARGSATYKRLLARQLLLAQFLNIEPNIYSIKKLVSA